MRIPSLIGEYLFPSGCAVCGRMLFDTEEAWYGLCNDCRALFIIEEVTRCSLCGRPLISEIDRCLVCRAGEKHYFDQALALFPYTGIYQNLLKAYKFDRYTSVGNFLLEKIYEGLSYFSYALSDHAVLVPVPPRPGKMKKTGWDQIDYLGNLLAKAYQRNRAQWMKKRTDSVEVPDQSRYIPVYRCLKRLASRTQKELSKEDRKTNLLNRIRCTRRIPQEVVLFDDVITTGSTLDACAAALKKGGAKKVYGLCLFYT
jgi:predicted amidophosphoribosyltransferase